MSTFPLAIRSSFRHSSALDGHIARSLHRALSSHASRLRRVEVWLWDANGPRHGAADKLVRVVLTPLRGSRVVAMGASDDLYVSASRAIARAASALARRVSARKGRTRLASGRRSAADLVTPSPARSAAG